MSPASRKHIDCRHVVDRHRGKVLNLADLGRGREDGIQVAASSGRVLARSVAANFRPVEDALYPLAQAGGRDRLLEPDRVQDAGDFGRSDGAARQLADFGVGIGLEGAPSLLAMASVIPGLLMGEDERLGATSKVMPRAASSC
jgi:hypothetical protein